MPDETKKAIALMSTFELADDVQLCLLCSFTSMRSDYGDADEGTSGRKSSAAL